MAADFRKFDEHGFPLPPRFEDLKYHDDEPKKRAKVSLKAKRWVLIAIVVLVIFPAFFGKDLLNKARGLVADWLSDQAMQKYMEGDLTGALTDMDQAVDWNPKNWELLARRGDLREELNDLKGGLSDFTAAIEIYARKRIRRSEKEAWKRQLSEYHSRRSWIYVRLGRRDEAMADADLAIQYFESPNNLNGRAYARAVLKIENQLEDGLRDVDTALRRTGNNPNMLDTRGYLLHLLGRNEEAKKDMDSAIDSVEHERGQVQRQFFGHPGLVRQLQHYDRALAVMYQHRGLIHQQLKNDKEAEKDLRRAEDLGYNPAQGVL
jgi:tetratricopeptide (TPR) repeat protein